MIRRIIDRYRTWRYRRRLARDPQLRAEYEAHWERAEQQWAELAELELQRPDRQVRITGL